jgi:hypothetical protein
MYRLTDLAMISKPELLYKRAFPWVTKLAVIGAGNKKPLQSSFPNLKSLLFYDCDKNTHFYCIPTWLSPSVTQLCVSGHPCDPNIVEFILDQVEQTRMHLTMGENFQDYWLRYRGRTRIPAMIKDGRITVRNEKYFEELAETYQTDLI